MGIVLYDGNAIIPAPWVQIQKQYQKTADGTIIGSVFDITLQGEIISYKGSPQSSGNFWTISGYPPDENISDASALASILKKQQALRTIFANEGRQLQFQPVDGTASLKCNPRVNNINFPAGNWYNRSEYTINLSADAMYINGSPLGEDNFSEFIDEYSESWSFDTKDDTPENEVIPRTYTLSHTVTAKGKRHYNDDGTLSMPAWQQAQNFVLPKLGFNQTMLLSSGVNNLPSYYNFGWNAIRNQQADVEGGTFSVTENWVIASGNSLELYTVDSTINNLDGYNTVDIKGTITGLEQRDSNMQLLVHKFTNASGRFNSVDGGLAAARATQYSGLTLNPIPISKTVTYSPNDATISYSYTYNNRPSNIVTGTKSEVIGMSRSFGIDIFGEVPVLGRTLGPILQAINSHQAATVALSIELVFGPSFAGTGNNPSTALVGVHPSLNDPQKTQIQNIVNAANPIIAGLPNNLGKQAGTQFVKNQVDNWYPREGRYSLQVEWVFE